MIRPKGVALVFALALLPTAATAGDSCGNGVIETGEQCDDSNSNDGDGCSSSCTVEYAYDCANEPSECFSQCGDGLVASGEQAEACDDGGDSGGDGCSSTCTIEFGYDCVTDVGQTPDSFCSATCGDGFKAYGVAAEECDDGDLDSGDGCSGSCTIEYGFDCIGDAPSVCASTCGDGLKSTDEECDDGDFDSDDGCSSSCTVEFAFECFTDIEFAPDSICEAECGDGLKAASEECDQGNLDDDDGCDSLCVIEAGYVCAGNAPSTCSASCSGPPDGTCPIFIDGFATGQTDQWSATQPP